MCWDVQERGPTMMDLAVLCLGGGELGSFAKVHDTS